MDARIKSICRDGIAVGVATGAYGLSFGAVAVTNGLSLWQTSALSALVFTGASQFAFVGVVGAGGSAVVAALSGLMLGTRNALYGMNVNPLLGWRGWRKLAASQLLIDESTAMTITRDTREEARAGFLSTGLAVFVLWNMATLVGAAAGQRLGDPRDYGLDAAVGAAFLGLLWPRLHSATHRLAAALAAALALSLATVTPAGVPVLAAVVVAIGLALLGGSSVDTSDDKNSQQ